MKMQFLVRKRYLRFVLPAVAALLVFCLLYTPCVAAIAAIRRELGMKWATTIIALQCLVAWVCAFIVKLQGAFGDGKDILCAFQHDLGIGAVA